MVKSEAFVMVPLFHAELLRFNELRL